MYSHIKNIVGTSTGTNVTIVIEQEISNWI